MLGELLLKGEVQVKSIRLQVKQKKPPLWLSIENSCCYPSSLPAMLLSALPTVDPDSRTNPVASHSFKIWSQIRKCYGWQSCSLQSPLIENHAFVPSFTNTVFNDWFERGIHSFLDIFIDQVFPNTIFRGHSFINIYR